MSTLEEIKRQAVITALAEHGSIERSAEALDIGRTTLYRMLADWQIDVESIATGRWRAALAECVRIRDEEYRAVRTENAMLRALVEVKAKAAGA